MCKILILVVKHSRCSHARLNDQFNVYCIFQRRQIGCFWFLINSKTSIYSNRNEMKWMLHKMQRKGQIMLNRWRKTPLECIHNSDSRLQFHLMQISSFHIWNHDVLFSNILAFQIEQTLVCKSTLWSLFLLLLLEKISTSNAGISIFERLKRMWAIQFLNWPNKIESIHGELLLLQLKKNAI